MTGKRRAAVAVRRYWIVLIWIAALLAPAKAEQSQMAVGARGIMQATLISPDGRGPYPGVLVLQTSGGVEQADILFAQALAKIGYVALVPAMLQAYGIPPGSPRDAFTTYAEPIYADLAAAADQLRHTPKVAGGRVGAVGFSNGGYFATWLAATGKVQAGVSWYGALSAGGTDIPQARFAASFSKTSAPMLILQGMEDRNIPFRAAQHLGRIIAAAGSPYELKLYPGAGHRFDRDRSVSANGAAAEDAWERTVGFLGRYLGGRS